MSAWQLIILLLACASVGFIFGWCAKAIEREPK